MTLLEQITENLVNEYMRVTGKGEGGKLALSPIEYLSFRTAAIQELQSGMGYVKSNIDNQNIVGAEQSEKFVEDNKTGLVENPPFYTDKEMKESRHKKETVTCDEQVNKNEYDMEEDENEGVMSLLMSIPG